MKDRYGMAHPGELTYKMRPYEARAANDQNPHPFRLLRRRFGALQMRYRTVFGER